MTPDGQMTRQPIVYHKSVLYPPNPNAVAPTLRDKPPGCRTIFIGNILIIHYTHSHPHTYSGTHIHTTYLQSYLQVTYQLTYLFTTQLLLTYHLLTTNLLLTYYLLTFLQHTYLIHYIITFLLISLLTYLLNYSHTYFLTTYLLITSLLTGYLLHINLLHTNFIHTFLPTHLLTFEFFGLFIHLNTRQCNVQCALMRRYSFVYLIFYLSGNLSIQVSMYVSICRWSARQG